MSVGNWLNPYTCTVGTVTSHAISSTNNQAAAGRETWTLWRCKLSLPLLIPDDRTRRGHGSIMTKCHLDLDGFQLMRAGKQRNSDIGHGKQITGLEASDRLFSELPLTWWHTSLKMSPDPSGYLSSSQFQFLGSWQSSSQKHMSRAGTREDELPSAPMCQRCDSLWICPGCTSSLIQ